MVQEVGEWFDDSVIDENEPLSAAMQQIERTFARAGEAARQTGQAVSRFRDAYEWGTWDSPVLRREPARRIGTTWLTDDRSVEITTVTPRYSTAQMLHPIRHELDIDINRDTRINAEYDDGTIIGANMRQLAAGYMLWPNCRMESMSTAQVGEVLENCRRWGRDTIEYVQRQPIEFVLRRPEEEFIERPTFQTVRFQIQQYLLPTRNSLMILHGA